MTVLTKPSAVIRKPIITEAPLVEKPKYDEEKIEIHSSQEWANHSNKNIMCTAITAAMFALLCFVSGLIFFRDTLKTSMYRNYRGYCTVPIPNEVREMLGPDFRTLPLRWSQDDIEILTAIEQASSEDVVGALREELEIKDNIERVSIVSNGHRVNFIHDFNDNLTGIVDEERCFVMDLEPEVVLSPELFISGLQNGEPFDVSRVRTEVHATLPAMQDLQHAAGKLAASCINRPVYRLYRSKGIRKREAEVAGADYMQFSGKHVQEIKIDNLSEVLEYEKKNKA